MNKLILILGMHRAGTSALAGVLTKLGASTIYDPETGSPENPKGFFESLSVMQINERLLSSQGSAWDDFRPITRSEISSESRKEVSAFLYSKASRELNVIKDPRLSRLGDLWLSAGEEAGLDVSFIVCCRHPLEVALSLKARNGMSLEKGTALWTRYMLDAEHVSRSRSRTFVFMSSLLEDWQAVIAQISIDLEVDLNCNAVGDEVATFLDKGLRHHVYGDDIDGQVAPIDALASEVYNSLKTLGSNNKYAGELLFAQFDRRFNEICRDWTVS